MTQQPAEPATPEGGAPAAEQKTFTQAELDAIVGDRLKRQKAQFGDVEEIKAKAAKFDEMQAAQQTEAERAAAAIAAAEQKASHAASALRAKTAENVLLNAAAGRFRVPSDAVLHLAGQVEIDDEGNVDPNHVAQLVGNLLENRPDLAAAQGPQVPRPNPAQGSSANGGGQTDARTEFAALFGAAQAR